MPRRTYIRNPKHKRPTTEGGNNANSLRNGEQKRQGQKQEVQNKPKESNG